MKAASMGETGDFFVQKAELMANNSMTDSSMN